MVAKGTLFSIYLFMRKKVQACGRLFSTDQNHCPGGDCLLDLHLCTGFLEGRLECIGFVFGNTLLEGLGRLVHEGLRFLQSEAGQFLDQLDHGQLRATGRLQDHVKLSLLLCTATSVAASRTSNCYCSCSCRLDAMGFFELISEFTDFFYCKVHQGIPQFFDISHFSGFTWLFDLWKLCAYDLMRDVPRVFSIVLPAYCFQTAAPT